MITTTSSVSGSTQLLLGIDLLLGRGPTHLQRHDKEHLFKPCGQSGICLGPKVQFEPYFTTKSKASPVADPGGGGGGNWVLPAK